MYTQKNATTLYVSWSPPTPLEDVTGYVIYYSGSDGSGGNVSVSKWQDRQLHVPSLWCSDWSRLYTQFP